MLFKLILLVELGCVAFFLCRYLDVCPKKKKQPKTITRRQKRKERQRDDRSGEEMMIFLENIDNIGINTPQRDFN